MRLNLGTFPMTWRSRIILKALNVCWHNSETKNLQKLIKKAENTGDKEKAMEYRAKLKTCMDRLNNRL